MSSNLEKQFEDGLEKFVLMLIEAIGKFFKSVFLGLKKLKNKYFLIVFLLSFIVPVIVRINNKIFFNNTKWYIKILYFILLITPLFYLFIISKFKEKVDDTIQKFDEAFRKINLIDIEGNVPSLIKKDFDELTGTDEYYFKSIIPVEEWRKKTSLIETGKLLRQERNITINQKNYTNF